MATQLIDWLVALLARLPLWLNRHLGSSLGWLLWMGRTRQRRVTEINLGMCFPEWTQAERRRVARRSLIETGKTMTESAWVWCRPPAQIDNRIVEICGAELLAAARQNGTGTLVATPHLGTWELCTRPLARESGVTYLYRSPRFAPLDPLLIRWRANVGGQPATLDGGGIKRVLKLLRSGENVGILPDQEPDRANGVFSDLFGNPANTMNLLAKLASSGRATVLFCFAERLPGATGWRVHYLLPDADIDSRDPAIAAAALNSTLERCIRLCPEQYLWSYRRFRLMPDGSRRTYR